MKGLKILFVEDSEFDCELVRLSLERSFHLLEFVRVESEAQLRERLSECRWDIVLSDYYLPGFSAQEALAFVRELDENQPFILVSGAIGEEKTVEILKFGADDVVVKNNLLRLPYSIERVLREHRIRESEANAKRTAEVAMRAREQMLTVVSHDLRNPLGAIQLNAETAIEKIANAESLAEARLAADHIKAIIRSSLRMKSLIADVLDKVRLEGGNFKVNPSRRILNDFVLEVVELFSPIATEKAIAFQVEELATTVEASIDFERLMQILSNLIGNAIKFTPPGGRVTLKLSLRAQEIEFSVQDTGPGIDDNDLSRIFEKYWQNQSSPGEGVGLGLSIAKELVKAHGGRIWVESEKGRGATFGFYIPCEWKQSASLSLSFGQPRNQWICLVDDDDDLRAILHENLKQLGYEVTSYASGRSALADLAARDRLPQLMILDYRLPDMSGGEVMERIRPHLMKKKIPVIFLSAEANLRNLADKHQASAFLTKPLRLQDLAKTIEDLL